jgi:hypothetical protein
MDDMRFIVPSKQQAWDIIGASDDFLRENYGLQLNQKTGIVPAKEGCEFIGKIITHNRIELRKDSSLRMKQHLDYVRKAYGRGEVPLEYAQSVIQSYLGILMHTDCKALRDKILEDYVIIRKSAPD